MTRPKSTIGVTEMVCVSFFLSGCVFFCNVRYGFFFSVVFFLCCFFWHGVLFVF